MTVRQKRRVMALDERNEEDLADVLETVQEMRSNNGELDLNLPLSLLGRQAARAGTLFIRDMRQFGYGLQLERDAAGRITRIKLLDQ